MATMDLKELSVDELANEINLYPWFGAARRELCARMSAIGGKNWGDEQYSDAALYISSRSVISNLARPVGNEDYSDKNVGELLKSYIEPEKAVVEDREEKRETPKRQIRVVGGDYFSQTQYDEVRTGSDGLFSGFAAKANSCKEDDPSAASVLNDNVFCTETLAKIYIEQGYYEEAGKIYSKLILAYPEKNAYFASQIQKLGTK